MAGNLTILIISFGFIILTLILYKVRAARLDVIDVYFLFAGLYFGALPFVKACLEDYSKFDLAVILVVFSHIFIILTIIWVTVRALPAGWWQGLEIRNLFESWTKINKYLIFLLIGIILIIQIIGFAKYGFVAAADHNELKRVGIKLPYWFSSGMALVSDLIFCAFLAVMAKIIVSNDLAKKLWIMPLIILIVSASFYGRRSLINLAVVGTILWFIAQGRDLFRLKYLKVSLILLVSLFLFSNLYQSYRGVLQYPPYITSDQLKNPLRAISDSRATLNNIKARPAAWEFNYLILKGQSGSRDIPYGGLFWQGFKNSIPSAFWPGKEVHSLNDLTAIRYGFPVMDYGKNNFAFTLADFGYLSIIIMPILMIMVFIFMSLMMRISYKHPAILLLVSGVILNYLINIEENYSDVLIMLRNITLVGLIAALVYGLNKVRQILRQLFFSGHSFSRGK